MVQLVYPLEEFATWSFRVADMQEDQENSCDGYICIKLVMELSGFKTKGQRRTITTELLDADAPTKQVLYEGCLSFSTASAQDNLIQWPLKLFFEDRIGSARGKDDNECYNGSIPSIKLYAFKTSSSNISIKIVL